MSGGAGDEHPRTRGRADRTREERPDGSPLTGGKAQEVLDVREEMMRRRSRAGWVVDAVGAGLARPWVFASILSFNVLWLVLNAGWIAAIPPWDPWPFPILSMITSVTAPLLTLLVLMRQHRDGRVAELREEVQLEVALLLERETSRILQLLRQQHEAMGIPIEGAEREEQAELETRLEPERLLEQVREHLDRTEGPTPGDRA